MLYRRYINIMRLWNLNLKNVNKILKKRELMNNKDILNLLILLEKGFCFIILLFYNLLKRIF